MKTTWTYIIIGIFLATTSCNEVPLPAELSGESSNGENDFIIFGHFYGFCGGEGCIEIFKITSSSLYEDTNDFYPSSEERYNANFKILDQSKFDKIKNVSLNIPEELLSETERIIGSPDAGDWGGIYLELSTGEFWLLDMNKDYLPTYLHDLRDQIRETISKVNE